jgi:hypothetical protein
MGFDVEIARVSMLKGPTNPRFQFFPMPFYHLFTAISLKVSHYLSIFPFSKIFDAKVKATFATLK